MRISDWSSDVCSSDLYRALRRKIFANRALADEDRNPWLAEEHETSRSLTKNNPEGSESFIATADDMEAALNGDVDVGDRFSIVIPTKVERNEQSGAIPNRSEEHTSELQSLMRISYAVFCLKKKKTKSRRE